MLSRTDADPWRRRVARGVLLLALASPLVASAQPTADEKAQAEVLFQDGKKLMTQKRYDEGCPKLEESQRLDPAAGTLLNLAVCHELQGRTATAWVEFGDALAAAKTDRRPERIKLAKEHLDRLEPKLSRLTVLMPRSALSPGLAVSRDGHPIHEAAFGTAIPVDPGDHEIVAVAPGRLRWKTDVALSPGEKREVTVPLLAVDPSAPAASASAPPPLEPPVSPPRAQGSRTVAYVALGGGAVVLAIGGYFGLRTLSRKNASDAHCPTATTCDAEGVKANDDAHRAAWISDVGAGVGLVAIGVGAYLWLTSTGEQKASTGRVRVSPSLARGGGSLDVGVGF